MFDGTLATKGPWEALVTFQQLIILADRTGIVDMTPEAISRRTTIPLNIIQTGLASLEEPDPDSRTPDEDGRRIKRLSDSRAWGWQIVNYEHYRNLRSADERREYHRQYHRKRRLNNSQHDSTTSTSSTELTHADAVSSKQVETIARKARNSPPKDESPVVASLPLREGGEFSVRQSLVAELEPIYPHVDVPKTLLEMRGWLLLNAERRKTGRGVRKFIGHWLQSEEEKHGG